MTKSHHQPVIWITGAGGLIGHYLLNSPAAPRHASIVGLTRPKLDLLDAAAVAKRFCQDSPTLIIHCAAISTAAGCAKEPDLARRMNVEVTRQLADLSSRIRLVFLSTDLVFDGRKGNYVESDAVNPLNLYAETKVEAEKIVFGNPNHCIVRTTLNAGKSPTGDRSFAEHMRTAWQRGETLKLFTDEFRSPIGADVTALAVWELAQCGLSGIFHVAGAERLNRLQIGQLFAARWSNLRCGMNFASLRDFPGPLRAADCSLNCQKAQSALTFSLPRFSDWLRESRELPL